MKFLSKYLADKILSFIDVVLFTINLILRPIITLGKEIGKDRVRTWTCLIHWSKERSRFMSFDSDFQGRIDDCYREGRISKKRVLHFLLVMYFTDPIISYIKNKKSLKKLFLSEIESSITYNIEDIRVDNIILLVSTINGTRTRNFFNRMENDFDIIRYAFRLSSSLLNTKMYRDYSLFQYSRAYMEFLTKDKYKIVESKGNINKFARAFQKNNGKKTYEEIFYEAYKNNYLKMYIHD